MLLNKNKGFRKKIISTMVLFVFVFSFIVPVFLAPQPAQATMPVFDWASLTWDKTIDAIEKGYKKTKDQLWKTGLKKIINNVAADLGTYLATGNKGGKPLIVASPKKYLEKVGDGVAGDLINNIAKGILGGTCQHAPKMTCKTDEDCPKLGVTLTDLGNINVYNPDTAALQAEVDALTKKGIDMGFQEKDIYIDYPMQKVLAKPGELKLDKCVKKGFDLCETDLRLKASLIGGVKSELYEGYKSECPISKMSEHYKELKDRKTVKDWIDFQKYWNPEANDIGVHLSLLSTIHEQAQEKVVEEEKKIYNGILPLTSIISGDVKTPASNISAATDSIAAKATTTEEQQTGTPWADAMGIFTKSFASKWLKQLFDKGLTQSSPDNDSSSSTVSLTSIKEVQKIYSSIFTSQIISGGNYDVLTNYLSCPDDLNFAQVDNCVLNQGMGSLLQNNERITFQDAINDPAKYPWINLPVGENRAGVILGKGSQEEGFSLENIKKMRLARIVPVGLEIAAKKIIDSSDISSKSLKEIVMGFNVKDGIFYHLVDPNWILKAPQHQC
ncbi:MAG: hypothetical protein AAB526_03015, partial [Patescibacteria group bacterium]